MRKTSIYVAVAVVLFVLSCGGKLYRTQVQVQARELLTNWILVLFSSLPVPMIV
mgnify:CR=1 FL=1